MSSMFSLQQYNRGTYIPPAYSPPVEPYGTVVTDAFTADAAWTVTSQAIRLGNTASLILVCTRLGAALGPTTDGNITNTLIGSVIAGYRPPFDVHMSTTNNGNIVAAYLSLSGNVSLSALPPNITLATGGGFTIQATYLVVS